MTPLRIRHRHDIEEKRFHIEIECFMIKKKLRQQAQILAIHLQVTNKQKY